MRRSGHKFVIATARPLWAAKKFLESVEIDAGIYHNGALLYLGKNKIDSYQIDRVHDVIHSILHLNPSVSAAAEADDIGSNEITQKCRYLSQHIMDNTQTPDIPLLMVENSQNSQ